jgi:hypothetical protein
MAYTCCFHKCNRRSVGYVPTRARFSTNLNEAVENTERVHHYCSKHLLPVKQRYKRKRFFHAYREP